MRTRTKTRKSADPALSFDGLGPRTLPPVLTAKAVASGLMPPLGSSALPPSLEASIPAALRYWTAKTTEEARAVRDELVERAVVRPADVLKVDGELRRVTWCAYLVEDSIAASVPLAKRTPVAVAGAACLVPLPDLETVAVDATDDPGAWNAERVTQTVKNIGPRVCLALSDTPEHREAVDALASAFVLETRPGVVYGSPLELDAEAVHVGTIKATTTAKAHTVRLLCKADAPTEERYVFGVVLEPDVVDSQKDVYSAEEVRKAAHVFMENYAQLGEQHSAIVTGKLKILESYVAPCDFTIGTEVVKAGTWLLAIRVVDDALWTTIKAGGFTGFSIGGSAIRQPDSPA